MVQGEEVSFLGSHMICHADCGLIYPRQPTPVNLQRADLKGHLERAVSNTFMNQNPGGTV